MKKLLTSSLLAAGGWLIHASERPNIVLFMVDDMGWQDTSEPFWSEVTPYNRLCHTPNMERLARQGVKFTQAYACAVSSPSRTSLMTGMNAARHRVTTWTLHKDKTTDAPDNQLTFPSWNFNGLQPEGAGIKNGIEATTLAGILRDNGYHTIHVGKAHWGSANTPGANPLNLGFDVNVSGTEIGGLGSYYGLDNFGTGVFHVTGLDKYHGKDINITEALTLEALDKLNQRPAHQPFYLYMSHYTVHVPIQLDSRFKDNPRYAGFSGKELAYLTMVEGMDKSLGDLLNWLEANGQAGNTIVLFMSDNGGHSSIGNITVDGKQYNHNYPLRSFKGSAYEGGIREPMLVKWPGVTVADTRVDEPVIIEDFFPSILEMAGVRNYTHIQTLDGKSFVPLLRGQASATRGNRSLYWHFPNRWGELADGSLAYSAVRRGDYKFIFRWHTGEMELYNIKEDIGERTNLMLSSNTEVQVIANSLMRNLSDYLRSAGAQRPASKLHGKLLPWPDEAVAETAPPAP